MVSFRVSVLSNMGGAGGASLGARCCVIEMLSLILRGLNFGGCRSSVYASLDFVLRCGHVPRDFLRSSTAARRIPGPHSRFSYSLP